MGYSIIATIVYVIIKAPVLFHCIYGITVVSAMLKVIERGQTLLKDRSYHYVGRAY